MAIDATDELQRVYAMYGVLLVIQVVSALTHEIMVSRRDSRTIGQRQGRSRSESI